MPIRIIFVLRLISDINSILYCVKENILEIIFEETSLQEDYKYRVEVHYKDDKVMDLVKGAAQNSPDGVITSYDIEQWIGAAIDGNINIFITEPTSKLYYIGPSTWRMEMLAKMPTQALAREIIAEIEIKTAKKLTALVKVEKKMHERPKSFEEFVKEDTNANWDKVKETIEKVAKKETEDMDFLKYKDNEGFVFCVWFDTNWKRDETIDISVDDVFNSYTKQLTVTFENGPIDFEKTVENTTHVKFYDKVCRNLQSVELIGDVLLRQFQVAYEDRIRKGLHTAILRHNVNARALYVKEQMKKSDVTPKRNNRQIEVSGTLSTGLNYKLVGVVDFGNSFATNNLISKDTPIYGCVLVLDNQSPTFRATCTISFDMHELENHDQLYDLIITRSRFYKLSVEQVNEIVDKFCTEVCKVHKDIFGRLPIKVTEEKKLSALLKELYDTEANWVATSKTHRRILYELDHLDHFQTAAKRQDLKKEERDVKEILKRLREHYEELYAAIRERLEQEES